MATQQALFLLCPRTHTLPDVNDIYVMQWLNEERLVQRLVEMIDPSQTPEVLLSYLVVATEEPIMMLIAFWKNIWTMHNLSLRCLNLNITRSDSVISIDNTSANVWRHGIFPTTSRASPTPTAAVFVRRHPRSWWFDVHGCPPSAIEHFRWLVAASGTVCASTLTVFRNRLKTFLFSRSFPN